MYSIKKIQAGALQYVLVISVIIAILLFAFISLIYLQQKLQIKNSFSKQAIDNVQMGFDYLETKTLAYDNLEELPLLQNNLTSITAKKTNWGIYDLIIVSSKVKNEYFEKVALVGGSSKKRQALYLKDNNQSLVVVGKTRIIGEASLPKQGVKSGNIAGVSYYGNQYVYGKTTTSSNKLPFLKNIEVFKNFEQSLSQNNNTSFELEDEMNLYQSFKENTLVFRDFGRISLGNIKLNGNIIVASNSKIVVYPSAKLNNIILYAPEVELKSGVVGNFQIISTKRISVGSKVNLSYPSALVLLSKNESNNTQNNNYNDSKKDSEGIFIEKNSEIRGVVFYKSESSRSNYNTQIHISPNTIITGEVYCSDNIALEGKVIGSVYTNNFILRKSGGIYVNHLYDATIDAESLPKKYSGLLMNTEKNKVVKWLD